jgi:hypothetical protein
VPTYTEYYVFTKENSAKPKKAAKAADAADAKPSHQSPKKCPDGKVLNPATGRCILSKNAMKAAKAVVKKSNTSPKKCPDGKVLNPATGRCILLKKAAKAAKPAKAAKATKTAKTGTRICSRILTPKQVGPICWFMATFVAMFYSQRSRRLLLNASSGWKNKKVFTLLKHVLDDKYLKAESRESEDYKKFSDDTFGNILRLLYKENSNAFPYNPDTIDDGYIPELYIGKLYNLLNIDYKMFSYNVADDILIYSHLNEEFKRDYEIVDTIPLLITRKNLTHTYIEENIVAPQVLMVLLRKDFVGFHYRDLYPNTVIKEGDTKKNIRTLDEKIYYLGVEYNLDSVVLENWNEKGIGFHAIAGITCKTNKFVYNGWTRTSMDPVMANKAITRNIPCELMPYNWNIKKHYDFCLNTKQCIPEIYKTKFEAMKSDLCFNFSKGKRILVYVRKDPMRETSIEMDEVAKPPKQPKQQKQQKQSPKKCPDGKVLNPATGRCILTKNLKK